jgi:hypothetical protein
MSVIICPSCKTPAPPGAIFCDHCGYDLRTVAPSGPAPQQPTFAVPGTIICPMCQHPNIAGAAFCENCGAQLESPKAVEAPVKAPEPVEPVLPPTPRPAPAPLPGAEAPAAPPAAQQGGITGRLVITDSQVTLPIPAGKQTIVIGREDPVSGVFPDIDLDPHGGHEGGVGRRHAQLIWKDGQVYLEDLESVNGTAVNRRRLTPRQPQALESGDEIRLGKMALIYYS